MKNISINKLKDFEGKEVQLNGWIYNLRSIGKIWFAIVRDGTGFVQCVVTNNDVSSEVFSLESSLTQESSVIVKGVVQKDTRSDLGFEILVNDIEVIHIAEEYPIALKEHGVSFLMDNRHLWLRSKKQYAIMKVRQNIIKSIRDFFDNRDFVLIDSPMFTGNAVEGTTTLFETEYFNRSAYLTQSGQLYQEAGAMAFGKTYCFGPCFRAEKSKTRKHLTEFWMVEPEMAFYDLKDNMDLIEEFIVHIVSQSIENCKEELKILNEIMESGHSSSCFPLNNIKLNETLPIIKNCKISVCNDSSFSHLSAALNIPTIVLMSDTPLLYGSYSPRMYPIIPDNENTVTHNTLGKEKINPQKIFNKFKDILS